MMSTLLIMAAAAGVTLEPVKAEQGIARAATAERAVAAAVRAFPNVKREEKPIVRPDRFDRIGESRARGK
jgi:hypothetical protein